MNTNALRSEHPSLDALLELLRGRRIVALAGAGCSTESGIPDYRGPEGRHRIRTPIQYQEFIRSEATRLRYWARSAIGWPRMSAAKPNPAHHALARLEQAGVLRGIITQNVDGLHHAAGSQHVVELHGSLASVRCMECAQVIGRDAFQAQLLALNAEWWEKTRMGGVEAAPDGDAELLPSAMDGFRVVACTACGGTMKPDVVFFGENVPRQWVDRAWQLFAEGDVLLVVGSSLTVYSGRRFIYRAEERGIPIGIVNLGPTRADEVAAAKVEAPLGCILPRLAEALLSNTVPFPA